MKLNKTEIMEYLFVVSTGIVGALAYLYIAAEIPSSAVSEKTAPVITQAGVTVPTEPGIPAGRFRNVALGQRV